MPELNNNFFGIAAGLLSVIAFIPYIVAIFRGQTKPSGASWWTWSILTFITVLSSKSAGATWAVLFLPLWLCFSQLGVAFLSIKRGDNNWDILNKICIGGALLGTVLWVITGQPLIALSLSILADFLASVPTFRHAFKSPQEENRLGWTLGWGSAVLEMFTISLWSLAQSGWAIYFLLNMTIILLLVWRPMIMRPEKN